MTNGEQKFKTAEEYFTQTKFFESGDVNAKKAFFLLGQYTKRVMECNEKIVAESGEEDKFQKKLAQLITSNMTYRVYKAISGLNDAMALTCNPKLFKEIGCDHLNYMVQSEYFEKRGEKVDLDDANIAFSLGLHQKF